MIPAPFEYERPATLQEALAVLAAAGGEARALAGGQSLLPLMKLRLARPARLVDIGRFQELRGVRSLPDGRLALGALTTWTALLGDARVMAHGALRDAVPQIGDPAVRNRGTIGGSLAHADPAADIAAPILALDGEAAVRSGDGLRRLPARELFRGPFATALEPGELITEVRIPQLDEGFGSAYVAVSHPASGYPIAGVAAVLGASAGGAGWATCRIGVTGVGEQPYRATEVEAAVLDGRPFDEAVRAIANGQRVLADPYADRGYRGAMAAVVARRALESAAARASAGGAG